MAGTILCYIGYFWIILGSIWIAVLAFQESVLWGIGCLLLPPFVILIFAYLHSEKALKPFLMYIGGIGLVGIGIVL